MRSLWLKVSLSIDGVVFWKLEELWEENLKCCSVGRLQIEKIVLVSGEIELGWSMDGDWGFNWLMRMFKRN